MERKMWKRWLSLAVALEMFLSPLSTAVAASPLAAGTEETAAPAAASERAETPAEGGETPAAQSADSDGADAGSSSAGAARGQSQARAQLLAATRSDYVADMSFGLALDPAGGSKNYPARYARYFDQEGGTANTWGWRASDTVDGTSKFFLTEGGEYYTLLPNTGRLPDLELEGFYVLGEAPAADWFDDWDTPDEAAIKSWVYKDSWAAPVRLEVVGPESAESAVRDSFTVGDDMDSKDTNAVLAKIPGGKMAELDSNGTIHIGEGVFHRVPIVARWVDSAQNQMTSLTVSTAGAGGSRELETLYTEDPTGKASPADMPLADIATRTEGQREFWLRVPEDQETLTLQFAAYEPYYEYNVTNNGEGECPVSVTARFNGGEVTGTDGGAITVRRGWKEDGSDGAFPQPTTTSTGARQPINTVDSPARSHWTVADIPLAKVAEATDAGDPYTTITLTITAPNGVDQAEYVFHVERLMTPTYSLGLGNTPLAMIEKDQTGHWVTEEADERANKDTAKADFRKYRYLGNSDVVAPGDYTYYKGYYDALAWRNLTWEGQAGYDIDLDETAVVAYQDAAFTDPGVTFVGSDGQKVRFGDGADGAYASCVTRTIQLQTADTLHAGLYGADSGTACWYVTADNGEGSLSETPVFQPLRNPDGSDGVDLRGLRVLPGVYTIEYTYTDPLDEANQLVAKRPLVVLPTPGDVNMDGAVTVQDALAYDSCETILESPRTTDVSLLKYRVMGTKDGDSIWNGYQPVLANLGKTDYFYPPLPEPENAGSRYTRKTWDEVRSEATTGQGAAKLELRYLGLERGILQESQEGYTTPATNGVIDMENGQMGPWQADEAGKVTLAATGADGSRTYGTYQTDTFWVGVYLTAGDLAGQGIEELTLSLIYDSNYVQPAVVYQSGQFAYDANQEERWYSALFYYNMGSGSKVNNVGQTLFSGTAATEYDYKKGSDWDRDYATHYSKVKGELETLQPSGSTLKEMVISFQRTENATKLVALPKGETCVLVVPFRLVRHPTGDRVNSDQEARVVELGAGMRDFNLVTASAANRAAGTSAAGMFAQLLSTLDGNAVQAQALGEGAAVYAYSAQESIYGGETQNLREQVEYAADASSGALSGLVPIGENKSVATELPTGRYAEEYREVHIEQNGDLSGALPQGLEYHQHPSDSTLSGTPLEVGTFRFSIHNANGDFYYVLTVEKRTLRYAPISHESFYGETEYRGAESGDFGFSYEVADLAEVDRPQDGTELLGAGEELAGILGTDYKPPAFAARLRSEETAEAVAPQTGIGEYPILLRNGTGQDDKYELVLDESKPAASLTIVRRPIWLDYITADTDAEVYSDSDSANLTQTITVSDNDGSKLHLAFRAEEVVDGQYGGRRLTGQPRVTGDTLTLTFEGKFQRSEADIANFPDQVSFFYLEAPVERRYIALTYISDDQKAAFDRDNPNYELHLLNTKELVLSPEENRITGSVRRQEITGLSITRCPPALQAGDGVYYGAEVELGVLRIAITRSGYQSGEWDNVDYEYDSATAQSLGIHYNWVTAAERAEGLKPENQYTAVGSGWDTVNDVDTRPYAQTNEDLSVAMSGMYLCAIVQTYDSEGQIKYVKCYSDNPITVYPKTVRLTLSPLSRFYGETSAEPVYTYQVNNLIPADVKRLRQEYNGGGYTPTGASDELEWLLGDDYTKPTILAVKDTTREWTAADNTVTVYTDVPAIQYYQVICGASSSNYQFEYARVGERASTDYGTAYLNIFTRPIVVQDVFSAKGTAEGNYKDNFAIVYADSKELLLSDQVDDGVHTPFTASAADDAADRVVFTTPNYDEDTKTLTYYNGGDTTAIQQKGMDYSGSAVLERDRDGLRVTYKVQFIPDQGHYAWNSLSQNFYDVDSLEETGGQGQRPVAIQSLGLEGAKAGNYMLVYNRPECATDRAPNSAEQMIAPLPTTSAKTDDVSFMAYGTGLVILRPIKELRLESAGRMSYTYGQYFAPDSAGTNGRSMVVSVRYDTRYDNFPAEYDADVKHNVRAETVYYTNESFDERSFAIHYVDVAAGQTPQDVGEDEQLLQGGDPLYPQVHDGKYLFVTGRRRNDDPLVYSAVTDEALRVAPAQLTLTARDVHRYYGEENARGYVIPETYDRGDTAEPFTYQFPASQLAGWDREMLSALLGRTVGAADILTQKQLETALSLAADSDDPAVRDWAAGFGYQKPNITTQATRESPVNNRDGSWGEYAITNTASSFTNYQVTGEGATLYVYPRPIRVSEVKSSEDDPLFTVYNKTAGTRFNTAYDQERVTVIRANAVTGVPTVARTLANSVVSGDLPLTGGALVGQDALTFKAQVIFPEQITLPEGTSDQIVSVVVYIPQTGLGSSSGEVEKNYVLAGDFEDPDAVAAVKLRTIGQVIIESLPKAKYTYGETLDLSGLQVRITYWMMDDESPIAETVRVKYIDPNQFQSYGLYVNYWDTRYDTLPDLSDVGKIKSLPNDYRKAATGDHVTIAPTHDTQQYLKNDMSRPLERPFAVHGAGLVISAFQDGDNQTPAQPKIVAARATPIEGTGVSSYEVTDGNASPFTFTVSPLRLGYTVSATDKTYNGDTKTAGTLQLTNLFDREGVQVQTRADDEGVQSAETASVTDVVYVPVGAGYEGLGDNYADYEGTAYRVTNGAASFTTGAYARRATGYLDKNDVVEWAEGYDWEQGLLEFRFPNPNVHYADETFADGAAPGVGTAALAAYWRADQEENTVDGRWDSYPDVSQMPVEVRNMTFTGPDAANYTWGPSEEPQTYATELTLDSDPADLGRNQASLPYATVHKANRQPIQDLLAETGFVLPQLEVDVHTNVVRLTYGEDLSRVPDRIDPADGSDGGVRNETGQETYRDELHFEYALAYQDEEGLLRRWAGRDGQQGYQDTRFFGGEVYLPEIDGDYRPDLERLNKIEDANEQTVYKGQRYQWAEEDSGVSDRGYREDGGFAIDPTAYPGYAAYGETVRDAYWYYDLYNTDRTGLPRDTVCYPLVRLAETHNYNPSGDLTADGDGDGQPDISAQALYQADRAVSAYEAGRDGDGDGTRKAEAEETSAAVFAAGQTLSDAAQAQAQAQVERDAAIAADSFPETRPEQPGPAGAVKTYRQRLDLVSASWERNSGGDGQEYRVSIVEDVKFTDTLRYPEQRLLDAVVYNDPTRYFAYAWDPDMSAQLRFSDPDNPIDLDREMTFAVRQRQPSGEVVDVVWTYDPVASNHTVQLYVKLSSGGGQKVRSITIVPSVLFARVGDRPIQLGLVTDPALPINRRYTWSSSDPSVATVSDNGLVTFRGEGTAVITVTTTNGKSDSIQVVVSPALPMTTPGIPMFNYYYTGAWADVDSDYAFRPKDTMTRGDVVRLLDVMLNPEYVISNDREVAYVDVTGKERYYGALVRLTRAGVVEGVPGSAFAGERLATRAEFVTMLARMLELNVSDTLGMAHAFADSGEDDTWAYAYIDAMAKAGVIQGVGGGCFAPSRALTREEAAAILARLVVNRSDIQYKIVPSDMTPENWSYAAVLRAVNTVMTPDL